MYLPRELREESEGQEDQEATKEMGPHHHLVLVIMMAQIAEVSLMASISFTFAWHSSAMLGWCRRYALIISVWWKIYVEEDARGRKADLGVEWKKCVVRS